METKSPAIRPSSHKSGLQGPNHNRTIQPLREHKSGLQGPNHNRTIQPLREQKAANDRWLYENKGLVTFIDIFFG
jgi:hypothetical protein